MGYGLSQGLITAGMFAYIAGSPFVVQKVYGASPQIFSLFFAINDLGIIIASQMTGRLAGRIAEQKMLRFGLYYAVIGSLCLLFMILLR